MIQIITSHQYMFRLVLVCPEQTTSKQHVSDSTIVCPDPDRISRTTEELNDKQQKPRSNLQHTCQQDEIEREEGTSMLQGLPQ